MLWLQESHSEQYEFGLDDLWLAFLHHNGAPTLRIGLSIDLLHFHPREFTILT